MERLKINHAAVWVCIVIATTLGFAWYNPIMFGDPWMAMVGLDMAAIEANPPDAGIWITNIVATVVPLYALAWLFVKLEVTSPIKGAIYGFLLIFCFHFLSVMTGNMFAMQPYALTWITGGFDLATFTISGFILGAWKKRR